MKKRMTWLKQKFNFYPFFNFFFIPFFPFLISHSFLFPFIFPPLFFFFFNFILFSQKNFPPTLTYTFFPIKHLVTKNFFKNGCLGLSRRSLQIVGLVLLHTLLLLERQKLFWRGAGKGREVGEVRVGLEKLGNFQGGFPEVSGGEWCGNG